MKLPAIFQLLELLTDFQTIIYGCNFVFQNETNIFHRHASIAVTIPYKLGDYIFINE